MLYNAPLTTAGSLAPLLYGLVMGKVKKFFTACLGETNNACTGVSSFQQSDAKNPNEWNVTPYPINRYLFAQFLLQKMNEGRKIVSSLKCYEKDINHFIFVEHFSRQQMICEKGTRRKL